MWHWDVFPSWFLCWWQIQFGWIILCVGIVHAYAGACNMAMPTWCWSNFVYNMIVNFQWRSFVGRAYWDKVDTASQCNKWEFPKHISYMPPLVPLVVQHHRQKTPNLPFKMWHWWTVFFLIETPLVDCFFPHRDAFYRHNPLWWLFKLLSNKLT